MWISSAEREEWEESEGSTKGEQQKLRNPNYNIGCAWDFWGGFLDMLQELKDIWDKANFLKQCLEFFTPENSLAMT